jgi:hypothetical protein
LKGDDLLVKIKEFRKNIENEAPKSQHFIDKGKFF